MENNKTITDNKIIFGNNEEDIFHQLSTELQEDVFGEDYKVILSQDSKQILLQIDIDPGGGFEGGYELTTLSSAIHKANDFRFGIHHEGFASKIGKVFGMEDKLIGYPEFDNRLIVNTNNIEKVRTIFADEEVRKTFQSLTGFAMHITHHHIDGKEEKEPFLEFEIERGITNLVELRNIYHAFFSVLAGIDN